MDTPIIALYYRESDPMKRKMFLDQSIAAGEEEEANAIRKELWEIRYGGKSEVPDTPADGYLALWMALEFNKNASGRLFGAKSARREIVKNLQKMKITEYQGKSALHQELLFRECCHMVRTYMELCEKNKLHRDIYETAIQVPTDVNMQEELGIITRAAKTAYEDYFPGEGGL